MYLTCGLASGTVGLCAILFLPDTPMNARFLTNPEKRTILQYVSVNGTGISNKRFEKSQLKAVFLDPQVWLLFLAITVIVSGSAILATYGTTIIRGFGYTSKQAALLNMPGGAFTFIAVVAFAFLIRYNWLSRIQAIVIGLILAITGTCLLAFLPAGNHIGQLFGLWMVSFSAVSISICAHQIVHSPSTKLTARRARLKSESCISGWRPTWQAIRNVPFLRLCLVLP